MSWYTTGSVAVSNGSATIIGTGTAWVRNVRKGDMFVGPDGEPYEVQAIVSDTEATLGTPYMGGAATGAAYRMVPTTSHDKELVDGITSILNKADKQSFAYATRAEFVAAQATEKYAVGAVSHAGGASYRYDGVSTAIPGLPGWVPVAADGVYPVAAFDENLEQAWSFSKRLRGTPGQVYTASATLQSIDEIVDLRFSQSEIAITQDTLPGLNIIYTPQDEQAITASVAAGATTITVTDGSAFAEGQVWKLATDELIPDAPEASGRLGEFVRVKSVAGNAVTVSAPIRYAYDHTVNGRIARIQASSHAVDIGTIGRPVGSASTRAMCEVEGAMGGKVRLGHVRWNNGNTIREVSCFGHQAQIDNFEAGPEVGVYGIARTNSEHCVGTIKSWRGGRHAFDAIAQAAGYTGTSSIWRHGHSAYNVGKDSYTYGVYSAAYANHHGTYRNRYINCHDVGSYGLVSFRGIENLFIDGSSIDCASAPFGSLQQTGQTNGITDNNEVIRTVVRGARGLLVAQSTAAAGLLSLIDCDIESVCETDQTRLMSVTGRGVRVVGGRIKIVGPGLLSSRVAICNAGVEIIEFSGVDLDFRGANMSNGGGGVRMMQQLDTASDTVMVAEDLNILTDGTAANRLSAIVEHAGGFTTGSRVGRVTATPSPGGSAAISAVFSGSTVAAAQAYLTGDVVVDGQVIASPKTYAVSIAAAPAYIGQHAVVGGVGYLAVGASGAGDWKQVTA